MNDGKGALRKGWQYSSDKMGETRKEWGLLFGVNAEKTIQKVKESESKKG